MSTPASETSEGFFALIHDLLRSPADGKGANRRRRRRSTFQAVQRIARYDGTGFPPEESFLEVRCHDLTRAGFSFLVPTLPGFDRLVAEFGRPPNLIYVTAEVVHAEQVAVYPSGRVQRLAPATTSQARATRSGRLMVLVGCRMLQRIEPPTEA